MKKYVYIIIALIIIVLSISYSQKPSAPKDEIRIGAVISLTGQAASFGEYAKNGMELAVSEINARGGINGRKVRVMYEDDRTDPKTAVSAFEKLRSVDKVNGVVGGLWDFVAQPLLSLAHTDKLVFITPSNFRIEGGFELNDQSFAMQTDFNKVIRKVADYLRRDDVRKIAVVHFTSTFGNEIARTITQVATELNKNPIIDESYGAIDTNDFKTTILKLKQQKVDTVFLDMVDADTINFLTRAKELSFTPKIITYVGSYDAFTKDNASLLEGLVILNLEKNTPDFVTRYKNVYHTDPTKFANRAYDSVYVLAEAIANSATNAAVASYIEAHTFTTTNGTLQFLPTHQVSTTPVELDLYQNGMLIPLQ